MDLEVISTKFRFKLPNAFDKVEPASELSRKIQSNTALDAIARSVGVYSDSKNAVWLYFALPNTKTDEKNMQAIKSIILKDINSVVIF